MFILADCPLLEEESMPNKEPVFLVNRKFKGYVESVLCCHDTTGRR
jgi:hypothetical protein